MIFRDSSVDARNELKFHEFVSLTICHVPLKPFFKKKIWKFQKEIQKMAYQDLSNVERNKVMKNQSIQGIPED